MHSQGTKIGLIGPAAARTAELQQALSLMFGDPAMREIIYLGDDSAVEEVADALIRDRLDQEEFLRKGAELACSGGDDAIFTLLAEARAACRMPPIRKLPTPPARAIEMMDKWIVLGVHDKAVLDEDDIASAHVIVYGRAEDSSFKRFGPRCFFTPGPLSGMKIGCLELKPEGDIDVKLLGLDGGTLFCETLQASGGKMVVTK